MRRITDHICACAIAIHKNVYPGARKGKYIIRRLLRRASGGKASMAQAGGRLPEKIPAALEQARNSAREACGE